MTPRLITLLVLAAAPVVANEPAEHKPPPEAPAHAQAHAPAPAPEHAPAHAPEPAPAPAPSPAPAPHEPVSAKAEPAATNHGEPAPPAHAATTPPHTVAEGSANPEFSIHPPSPQQAASPEEIASLVRIGMTKVDQGDYVSAELAFRQVLAEKATPEQDHTALMGLGRTYRKKSEFTKAAAVYETLVKQSPEDPLLPIVYLELGRTLRALGAYKPAIARFYSVINTTLKLPEDNSDNYRQLARTAQFEIAETYFQAGDYEQANRYFSRLKLLDLAPEDRARAHFKSIYALTLSGEHDKAIVGFRAYLDQNPMDENVPEARYLLSVSLRQLGRFNESLAAALELLRAEKKYSQSDPKRWAYWQRKTGNQLANQFYEQGDFGSALVIYQNLANLSAEPAWRLPVLYQIGLCNERLHLYDRARECYQTIVDGTATPPAGQPPRRQEFVDLYEMADWRLKHLTWSQTSEAQLKNLFPNQQEVTAALIANDTNPNPNPATPSGAVR